MSMNHFTPEQEREAIDGLAERIADAYFRRRVDLRAWKNPYTQAQHEARSFDRDKLSPYLDDGTGITITEIFEESGEES